MIFVIITYAHLWIFMFQNISQNISYKNCVGFIWELLLYPITAPLNCRLFEGKEMGEKTRLSKGILWINVFFGGDAIYC